MWSGRYQIKDLLNKESEELTNEELIEFEKEPVKEERVEMEERRVDARMEFHYKKI